MQERDALRPFVFENLGIRGEVAHLSASWQGVLERHDYPPPVRRLLGEAMAAAALLVGTLKFKGKLTLQIQSRGPLSFLVIQCSSERTLRGMARSHELAGADTLAQLCPQGTLAITLETQRGHRYQGIVELQSASLAQALEQYFRTSEQLPTRLWLAANDRIASGMLIQELPDGKCADADAWSRVGHLASTVKESELLTLDVSTLLRRLFHEEDVRLFDAETLTFGCGCSRLGVNQALRALGRDEAMDVIREQGRLRIECDFCARSYVYDAIDIGALFATEEATEISSTQH